MKPNNKKQNTAPKVFARLGFEDKVVTMDEWSSDKPISNECSYFVGFEDEDGNECEEDGTYLNQD